MRLHPCLTALGLASLLAACSTQTTTDTTSGELVVEQLVPQQATPGQSVGLGLLTTTGTLKAVQWRQLSGPTVTFQGTRSKLIGFDVPEAGEYSFEATLQASDDTLRTSVLRFTASGSRPQANIRLDRAVTTRGQGSLRAWHGFGSGASVTYRWEQTSGPAATLRAADRALLLFETPAVERDTLLTFRVTITRSDGTSATDEAWVLVDHTRIDTSGIFFLYADMVTGRVHHYRHAAPHAQDLAACVFSNTLAEPCRLSRLPLIAQETRSPSVEDVMNRVLVSHDWMGQRFEEFLSRADTSGDLRRLLRPVTAVVLSADIRPSFYWAATGAIYLDPGDLWQTPEERDTIHETPDYRSDFDRDLQFAMPWRLVKNNDYTGYYYPPEWRGTRTLDETRIDLASLLYHELAHANDFIPPSSWGSLFDLYTPLTAAGAFEQTSTALAAALPLGSAEMRGLAGVAFEGETADEVQKAYLPAALVPFFVPDRSADFYSYSGESEDLAELFSFLLLRYRYGVDADIAITNNPSGEQATGRDYIVTWGQRGRIGEAAIRPRVRFVTERLLPELDVPAALAALPAPKPMRPGLDWVANLDLGGGATATARPDPARLERAVWRPVERLPRHGHWRLPPNGNR